MAVMQDKYAHLPGHLTEFKDGGLQLVQEATPPKTESVLILGTAVDGPIMEPVRVDASTYEAVFGKVADERGIPNGATLGQKFEECWNAGCRDIRLMRVSGAPATATIVCTDGQKLEESVYESTLGVAGGNVEENSVCVLSKHAEEIVEVKINGVVALSTDYKSTCEIIEDSYVDADGNKVDDSKLESLNYILESGKKVVVGMLADAVYENDTTGEFYYLADLAGDTTGYTKVADSGDYCRAAGTTIAEKLINPQPATADVIPGKGVGTEIYNNETLCKVAIKTNICDSGSYIDVKYIDANGMTISENSSVTKGPFIANGKEVEFVLPEGIIPYANMTKLYFDGVEYIEADITQEDASVKVFEVHTDKVTGEVKITVNPGRHAKRGARIEVRLPYKKLVDYVAELKLETSFGGAVYNGTQWQIETKYYPGEGAEGAMKEQVLKIFKPRAKRSQLNEEPLSYSSFDYPTLGLMARAINNDARNGGFVKAYVNDDNTNAPTSALTGEAVPTTFKGGDDGINLSKQELFAKLSGMRDAQGFLVEAGAYQVLENYTVDYVVVGGVCADDKLAGRFDNFAYELALFCAVVSHRNHSTLGVISTTSPSEPTLRAIEDHVQKLEAYPNEYLMRDAKGEIIKDLDNNTIDLGKYIAVLAGGDTIMVNQRLGQYAANSEAALAGFLSTLPTNSAPTNKVVKYAGGLRIKYSNQQLDRLTAKRYVTLKYKGDGSVAIVDAMTASLPGSDYERVSSMRAVRELANETREVADPFLGEPNTPQQRNALSALLDKRYGQHKEAGTMRDYSFELVCTPYDELVGAVKILLTIVPSQELRKITTVISLKPSI